MMGEPRMAVIKTDRNTLPSEFWEQLKAILVEEGLEDNDIARCRSIFLMGASWMQHTLVCCERSDEADFHGGSP